MWNDENVFFCVPLSSFFQRADTLGKIYRLQRKSISIGLEYEIGGKAYPLPLIPDTPSPMMRNQSESFTFHLLNRIVQEEIYKDCIDMCFRILAHYLATNKLHTPDTTPP